jgi:hypothetical protein
MRVLRLVLIGLLLVGGPSRVMRAQLSSPYAQEVDQAKQEEQLRIQRQKQLVADSSKLVDSHYQPWTFVSGWILGTTSCTAVVPDTYRLQAGDADDTTLFHNHPLFHEASLERAPRGDNALFGEEQSIIRGRLFAGN